jgi:hypothetical protein
LWFFFKGTLFRNTRPFIFLVFFFFSFFQTFLVYIFESSELVIRIPRLKSTSSMLNCLYSHFKCTL